MEPRLIKNFQVEDLRGSFTKVFTDLKYDNLEINFKESYFSINKPGVWRGLHFQTPPMDHWKLVTIVEGEIVDYVVDIRKDSLTYGQKSRYFLKAGKESLLIPPGYAHGFLSVIESIVLYNVSTVYSPENDMGLSYKFLGAELDINHELMSSRDLSFTNNIEDVAW
ncbi:dTDP-4-dehydrorhamnose 3,5-epimerase [Schleiferiaceae bacterium]|jgi:dTDP-4-dehydrorhamnose 3,5-epimerase|nr:dTDP-4-dehydrorhamnose 3,5-epimerase [Schleiferiaceae bacterium]